MIHRRAWACFVAAFLASSGMASGQTGGKPPRVEVTLGAEHQTLVPGGTTTLAIGFKLESGWHIYWQNRGEGGLEPTFEWKLPEGYKVGPVRFPPPKRHIDGEDTHTFVLEGEPILLADLSVPATAAAGAKAPISLDVNWMACKELCVIGKKSLSLELPVAAERSDAGTDPMFKMARSELPLPMDKAKYMSRLSAVASVDKVRPGGRFEVAVVLDIQPQHHINSSKPLSPAFIPTDLFPYATEGLTIGRAQFPPGEIEELKPPSLPGVKDNSPGEKVSVYRGKAIIRLPVEASGDLKGDSLRIGGVITYQACSDLTKQCFRPTSAEWTLTLSVAQAGQPVQQVNAELFPGGRGGATTQVAEAAPPDVSRTPPSPGASTVGTQAESAGGGPSAGLTWQGRAQNWFAGWGLIGYLVLAMVGGFILNLMPCVLPVISIKILSFVQQAKESRLRVLTMGLSFAAGIQLSFVVLGLLILGLARGIGVGQVQWGGLFQRPEVVIGLAAIVMAFALSLFGVFSLSPPRFVNELGGQVSGEGHVGAFATGLLATILGTACTAPFLSFVIAIAAQRPPLVGMSIFVAAGFGMAVPYIFLAAFPGWLKIVPKPGPWMTTFEHVMGFLLLGTVVWLLNPLAAQLGGVGLVWTLVFLLFVAAAAWCYGRADYGASSARQAAWCYGRADYGASSARQAACYSGALLLVVAGWLLSFRTMTRIPDLVAQQKALVAGTALSNRGDWTAPDTIPWVPYTPERAAEIVRSGRTVFVDYTAEWCVNCKANEKLVLNTPEVREVMRRLGVVPMKADYTTYDPQIEADLKRFNRSGVPMYVILPAGRPDEPILLNEILTKAAVIEGLEKTSAAPTPAPAVASSGR